ncbi:MAG: glycosyltransferase family 9 protein [Deltaproteobacteria bacterium]|nr:glycosyltransferase family 9 protein [Deltaproteobacteria bacterium]
MKIITPGVDLSVNQDFKSDILLKEGVEYVVADDFPVKAKREVGPGCVDERDYVPDNFYRGEDLDGKSLFCFRTGGIGDLLFITTALRQLKRKFPSAKLALGCNYVYSTILDSRGDGFEQVPMPLEKRSMDHYDYILFFQGIIEGNPEAEAKNAYDLFKDAFYLEKLEDPLPRVHVEGKARTRARDFIMRTGNGRRYKIGVQISPSLPVRAVPPQLFIDFVTHLNDDFMVYFIGGEAQWHEIDGIINRLPQQKQEQAVNASRHLPTLVEAAALIGEMDLVVGPDSSMLHVAAAYRKPLIGLYGPFPSDLRLRYYENAIGLDSLTLCEFARGPYSACFEHGEGECRLARKTGEFYSPCMMFFLPKHLYQAMHMLGFPVTMEETDEDSEKSVVSSGGGA